MAEPIVKAEWRNGLVLGAIAVIALLLVIGTQSITKNKIISTEKRQLNSVLSELLPSDLYDNDLTENTLDVVAKELGGSNTRTLYRASKKGEAVGIVLPVTAPDGYSGNIELLLGLLYDGSIVNVRVIHHRETPGLGDDIDTSRSDWILGFNGLTLDALPVHAWQVKKDGGQFDQFTGATITPRAVVAAINKALIWYKNSRDSLYAQTVQE